MHMRFTLLVSLTLIVFRLTAQSTISISGKVLDRTTNKPLPFATVSISNNSIGTICNANGEFKLLIPASKEYGQLKASYLGYEKQSIDIHANTKSLVFKLQQQSTTLEEVVVTGYNADNLIAQALEKIPDNYFQASYLSSGFYRLVNKKDQAYIHLSEAVFDIYQSRDTKPNKQFRLEKMRAIKDEFASKGIDLGMKTNSIFGFDLVNHTKNIGLLSKKGLKLHEFELKGIKLVDGRETFEIAFDQKEVKKSGYTGTLYIDKEDLAFTYFDFELSPRGIAHAVFGDAATRVLLELFGLNIDILEEVNIIRYKKIADRYYLSDVESETSLRFRSERQFFNFTSDARVDYVVTEIETKKATAFPEEEILGNQKVIEQQNSIYDADFWANHNIILPTSNFGKIARDIESKNKANDTKEAVFTRIIKLPKDKKLRVDSILTIYNQKGLFNGNALIIAEEDTVLRKSFNNTITQNKLNSQFRIGSLSKSFTAMLMVILEEQNLLYLNDSISTYLPDYRHPNITIHQLLTHQSGIPNFLSNHAYLTEILTKDFSLKEVVTRFCSDSLEFAPGSKFTYSNSGYVVLSLIAEKVTEMSFGEALDHYIFSPLEMKNTYFGDPISTENLVTGYYYDEPEKTYPLANVGGAGGITSTLEDLMKWSLAMDSNGLIESKKLNSLTSPYAFYEDWDADYGYGWMIDRRLFPESKKHKIFYHPGTDFGFYSMFLKQPDEGITIILLNNTGDFPRFEMAAILLEELNR